MEKATTQRRGMGIDDAKEWDGDENEKGMGGVENVFCSVLGSNDRYISWKWLGQ